MNAEPGQRLPRRVTRGLLLEGFGGRAVDEPIQMVGTAGEVFLVSTTRRVRAVSHGDGTSCPHPVGDPRGTCPLGEREHELLRAPM